MRRLVAASAVNFDILAESDDFIVVSKPPLGLYLKYSVRSNRR